MLDIWVEIIELKKIRICHSLKNCEVKVSTWYKIEGKHKTKLLLAPR